MNMLRKRKVEKILNELEKLATVETFDKFNELAHLHFDSLWTDVKDYNNVFEKYLLLESWEQFTGNWDNHYDILEHQRDMNEKENNLKDYTDFIHQDNFNNLHSIDNSLIESLLGDLEILVYEKC